MIRYWMILVCLGIAASAYAQTVRDPSHRLLVTIKNGEIRDRSTRKLGSINEQGAVRDPSSRLTGTIKDGRVVDTSGRTLYLWDSSGRIRQRNGTTVFTVRDGGDIRNASGRLLYTYKGIPLIHLVAYLSFFQ